MRARGLKHDLQDFFRIRPKSRPMRARGLKQRLCNNGSQPDRSRPMRARGLKLPQSIEILLGILVAPHAGAWIET